MMRNRLSIAREPIFHRHVQEFFAIGFFEPVLQRARPRDILRTHNDIPHCGSSSVLLLEGVSGKLDRLLFIPVC